ncbi:hypothetical protein Tco_1214285 [Tanacetum coccineum]
MICGLNQLMERKEYGGMYLLWVSLIGDVRTLMMDEAHASRYLVNSRADKTYYDLRDMYDGHVWRRILLPIVEVGDKVMLEVSSWKEVVHFGKKEMLAPRYKYLADTNLHVHLEEIKVDKTLPFVEEHGEIIEREVKSLKRSRILIVKSIRTRSEREGNMNRWLIEDEDESLGYEASKKEVESSLESTARSKPKRKKLKKTAKAISDRMFCNSPYCSK